MANLNLKKLLTNNNIQLGLLVLIIIILIWVIHKHHQSEN